MSWTSGVACAPSFIRSSRAVVWVQVSVRLRSFWALWTPTYAAASPMSFLVRPSAALEPERIARLSRSCFDAALPEEPAIFSAAALLRSMAWAVRLPAPESSSRAAPLSATAAVKLSWVSDAARMLAAICRPRSR